MSLPYTITTSFVGEVDVNPRLVRVTTSATFIQVTTEGFLSSASGILPTDFICVNYVDGQGMFRPVFSGLNITLALQQQAGATINFGRISSISGGSTFVNLGTPAVLSTDTVVVNFVTQTNPSEILTVTPTDGVIGVALSAAPGLSEMSWIAVR
jgi:hypothetical protein